MAPPPAARQFKVCAVTATGRRTEYHAIGGSSCGHLADAIEAAGLGGSVSVRPLRNANLAGEVRPC